MTESADNQEGPGRKLGLSMCIALVMGNMIGSGVFLLPAQLAPYGWNAVAGWIVTIGGAVCLAIVLAKLAGHFAETRGIAPLIEQALGPLTGSMIGFSFWVSVWTGLVTISLGAVSYASAFWPVIGMHPGISAIATIWFVTLINLLGVRAAGAFQLVTTVLKLAPLIVVAALIAIRASAEGANAFAPFPADGLSIGATGSAAALALWAMVGFEAACAAGDKIDRPAITIPRATVIGALLTGLLYLTVCSGIALMLPADEVAASPAPFALFVERYWAAGPAALVTVFAAISAIGALNGWVLVQGEVPRDMARRRLMPGWFGAANARGTPVRALIVSSCLASLLVFANSSRSMGGLFSFMALLSTCATLWLYLACAVAAARYRIALPYVVLGGAYALWAMWGAGREAVIWSVALMLVGLPLYWLGRRSSLPAPAVL